MLRYSKSPFSCDAILFSMDNKILGSSRSFVDIQRDFQ